MCGDLIERALCIGLLPAGRRRRHREDGGCKVAARRHDDRPARRLPPQLEQRPVCLRRWSRPRRRRGEQAAPDCYAPSICKVVTAQSTSSHIWAAQNYFKRGRSGCDAAAQHTVLSSASCQVTDEPAATKCCCGRLPGTRPPSCSLLLCCSSSSDEDPEMLDTYNIIGFHYCRVMHDGSRATCTYHASDPAAAPKPAYSNRLQLQSALQARTATRRATHVLVAAYELLELRLAQGWPAAVPALDVDAVPVRLEVLPLLRLTGEHPGASVYAARHAAAADRSCSCRTIGACLCWLCRSC